MGRIKQAEQIESTLVTKSYALLFIVLAFWTSIPIFINKNYQIGTLQYSNVIMSLTFSIICIFASFGTLNKNKIFGRFLGLILLSTVLVYQSLRLLIDKHSSPLMILSIINFLIVIIIFEKIMKKDNFDNKE
jgi:hypothetical protein